MSVLITSVLVGCGILVGRLIARGSSAKEAQPAQVPATDETQDDVKPKAPPAPNLDAFPCKLGDVVLRGTGEEAWLAGAIVLREGDEPAAVLFFSPEAGGDRAVLARPASQEITWLAEEKGVTVPLGEPPTALEAGTNRYERRRRLPLRAERVGTGAPDLGREVILAEYTGLGDDNLVVLVTKERVVAFRGPSLGAGAYDVLPGKLTAS
ncbi:MAG TPA: hypothetical protein VGH87_26325 [Polyangiaceae bacterium]